MSNHKTIFNANKINSYCYRLNGEILYDIMYSMHFKNKRDCRSFLVTNNVEYQDLVSTKTNAM